VLSFSGAKHPIKLRIVLARIIHRFLSRSGESAAMTRRATKGTTGVLVQYAEEPKAAQHSQRG